MNNVRLLMICIAAIYVAVKLRKDFKRGIMMAVALLVAMPATLIYETSGMVPNLSVHRVIIVVILIFWIREKKGSKVSEIKHIKLIYVIAATLLVSSLMSVFPVISMKKITAIVVEIYVFYIIISTIEFSKDEYLKLLKYISYSMAIVATIAVIEKYVHINPVDLFLPGYVRKLSYRNDIMSTYPHRILLGVGMAMVWPVIASLSNIQNEVLSGNKNVFKVMVLIVIAANYFSMSRGPWLAAIVAGTIYVYFGTIKAKKWMIAFVILIFIVLIVKPGVMQTITHLGKQTFEMDSVKGNSYQYRWELWKKAYMETKKSTKTILLGYGPGTAHDLDLGGNASYDGSYHDFWSWDNQYAANLLEMGYLGFLLTTSLYVLVLFNSYKYILRSSGWERDLNASLLAGMTVLVFMMSNVAIFAPQLNYMFWSFASVNIKMND